MVNSAMPASSATVAAIMARVPTITLTPAEEYELGRRAYEVVTSASPALSTDQVVTEVAIELFVPDYLIAPALVSYLRSSGTSYLAAVAA